MNDSKDPELVHPLCQYCDKPRTHLGYFGTSPVSLCKDHKEEHGQDFDRVVEI